MNASGEAEARALSGDQSAWNELIQRHTPRVIAYLRSWEGAIAGHAPQDIAQEAWTRLWTRVMDGVRGTRAPVLSLELPGLALAQARFVALELARRKGAQEHGDDEQLERVPAAASSPDAQVHARAQLLKLRALVATLPERDRQAWELRYLKHLDTPEIAEIMGISPGAVRMAVSRSRKVLSAALRSSP